MRPLEIGLVLPVGEVFAVESATPRWTEIRELVVRAERIGFDIVWISDELLWRATEPNPQGFWEGVAMTGAVAASTSRIKVGTWILSALHRNPGLTAKVAETIDEVSGGRFVFGLGAGHAGSQGRAFGLPEDHVVGRFEEAVQIIVPLLRAQRVDFDGDFHTARNLVQRPVGPRPGRIPLLIGAKGPRMLRIAALHADIWSWFVEERSDIAEFAPRLAAFERACEEVGRDPATAGKSAGVVVEPTDVGGSEAEFGTPIRGSAEAIADAIRSFAAAGYTNLELVVWPPTPAALEALAPVLELVDGG
jgi:alkanesulfonate monooxygenase SsuD/methylene tetrahydromethanopterin reductase-like flavin-dependent oxidoreductase (luciferase family)